jgi:tRNA modification GTPase
MFSLDDTIVAIATPLGRGAIGVVRISGGDAQAIAQRLIGRDEPLVPRHATFARLIEANPIRSSAAGTTRSIDVRDHVVVTFFRAPHSYTGGDLVEIGAHGSPVVLRGVVQAAIASGARLAEPGEFTLRAFMAGKLDLVQAEAVADLVDAVTPLQARAAFDQLEGTLTARINEIEAALFDVMARLEASLDFPDEGYHFVARGAAAVEIRGIREQMHTWLADAARGRIIREGAQIAIVGSPNVGKSSLFNALLNANRAIVTPIAGTTRDLLTERVDIRGIATSLVDTAGIHQTDDVVEQEGVSRARGAAAVADLTLVVLDRSRDLAESDRDLLAATLARPRLVIVNKVDLPAAWARLDHDSAVIEVSVKTGDGLDVLQDRIASTLGGASERRDHPLVSNVRHAMLLSTAAAALDRASTALEADGRPIPEEFILLDLQDAVAALQEVTGRRTTDDLLAHIFSRFCVGK